MLFSNLKKKKIIKKKKKTRLLYFLIHACFVRMVNLLTKDLDALLEGLEVLVARLAGAAAEDELSIELPTLGDLPRFGNLLVDEGVVVLQIGAEALELKGGPGQDLLHAEALGGPAGELVGVGSELSLHAVDDVLVVEEEDGAGAGLEAGHAAGGGLPGVLRDDGLEDVRGHVPQLVVLSAEEHEHAVGLGVERGGGVQGELVDDVGDARCGHRQLLVERVVGAAALGQLDKGVGGELGGHCEGVAG